MALSDKQQAILDGLKVEQAQVEENAEVAGGQGARMFAQGLTFGWADEVEAFVRSTFSDRQYDEVRDEIRAKMAAYKEANPTAALSFEVAGALVPGILSAPLTAGASTVGTLGRLAAVGAVEGGLYGAGASEAEDLVGVGIDTATGVATGGIAAPVVGGAFMAAGGLKNKIVNMAREKFGAKASDAVQAELQRIVEQSGKSVEEITLDIAEGRVMAENKTLTNVLKNIVNEGGEAGKEALEKSAQRARLQRNRAMSGLAGELTEGTDPNVIRGFKTSQEQLKKEAGAKYDEIFKVTKQEASTELGQTMETATRSNPELAEYLNRIYNRKSHLVPLFKKEADGTYTMVRKATIEDAELMRRALDDMGKRGFKAGEGTLAALDVEDEKKLRALIDAESVDLKNVRAEYASMMGANEAFDKGRKALTTNIDELEMDFEALKNDPAKLKAFQAGVMDSIRNKVRRTKTTLAKLADEDAQFGQALRIALEGAENPDRVIRQLQLAGESAEVASKMPLTAGSPTAGLQAERARAGRGINLQTVEGLTGTGGVTGAINAVGDVVNAVVDSRLSGLTPQQRKEVVDVLFSENADQVRLALTDDTAFTRLMEIIDRRVSQMAAGLRTGATQQAAGAGVEFIGEGK